MLETFKEGTHECRLCKIESKRGWGPHASMPRDYASMLERGISKKQGLLVRFTEMVSTVTKKKGRKNAVTNVMPYFAYVEASPYA